MPVMATLARERKIILIPALVSSVIVFILIKFKVNLFRWAYRLPCHFFAAEGIYYASK